MALRRAHPEHSARLLPARGEEARYRELPVLVRPTVFESDAATAREGEPVALLRLLERYGVKRGATARVVALEGERGQLDGLPRDVQGERLASWISVVRAGLGRLHALLRGVGHGYERQRR